MGQLALLLPGVCKGAFLGVLRNELILNGMLVPEIVTVPKQNF